MLLGYRQRLHSLRQPVSGDRLGSLQQTGGKFLCLATRDRVHIYPALLYLKRRFGWTRLLAVSYVGALLVITRDPTAGNYASYGIYFNWLLGLPCWLLGCCLAERADTPQSAATVGVQIWAWRAAAWSLSSVCSVLRFHTLVTYPWSLSLFGVFVFFWLSKEIGYYRTHAPLRLLENSGKGSYSIYLVHLLGFALFEHLPHTIFGPTIVWFAQLWFTLLLCYVFYLFIERPSHLLARMLGERLVRPRTAPVRV